jgi:membrane protein
MLGPLGGIGLMLGNWLIALAAITFVIATIYHVSRRRLPWRWFSPGSVIFTLGFGGTTILFSFYVAHFASYDKTYGSLGAVIILLLWMYLVALLVVFGGEVTHLDRQSSAELRPVQPAAPAPEPDPATDDLPRWATERSGFED